MKNSGKNTDKLIQRSTQVTFFAFIGTAAFAYYAFVVGFSLSEVLMSLILVPVMMLGIEAGLAVFRRTQSGVFKTLTYFLLLAVGVSTVLKGSIGFLS